VSYPRTSFDFVLDCHLIFLPYTLLNEGEGRGGGIHDVWLKPLPATQREEKPREKGLEVPDGGWGGSNCFASKKACIFFLHKVTTKLLKTEALTFLENRIRKPEKEPRYLRKLMPSPPLQTLLIRDS
jgi:hypothetical protein